ncbi:MAG TPA: MCP four helix bundle domain-containing protein, partial [Clostridia bacterium]|nr:MCP four helix bundle domain-containing protein [Clostridia bacterium]
MLKNMRIGKKLVLTFLFVTLISSIGGFLGLQMMSTMNSRYSEALVSYGFAQGDIGLFNTEFNNNSALIRDLVIRQNTPELDNTVQQISRSNAKLTQYLDKMKTEMVTDKEKGYYDAIKASLDKYAATRNQAVQFALSQQAAKVSDLVMNECTPRSNEVRTAVETLIKNKSDAGNSIAADLKSQAYRSAFIIVFAVLLSILFSLFIAVRISRGISKPVAELAEAAKKMAEGDLSVEIKVNTKDEIGQLGAAFSETVSTIHAYIEDIRKNLAKMEQGDLTIKSSLEYKGDFIYLRNSIAGIVNSLNDVISQIQQSAEQVSSGSG